MRKNLYSSSTVKSLFSEMSKTYGRGNLLASFGFSLRWRRQCVLRAGIEPGHTVYDFMTGMGECLPLITAGNGKPAAIKGVDFCSEMCSQAQVVARGLGLPNPGLPGGRGF